MSKSQVDLINDRNDVLDEFEKSRNLPLNKPPGTEEELQRYLSMDKLEVMQLSASAAIGVSYRLSLYSLYFQRCSNRERSNKAWAEAQLSSIVCSELMQLPPNTYLSTADKLSLVCKQNAPARSVKEMLVMANQRIERLSELSSAIQKISYVISLTIKVNTGD